MQAMSQVVHLVSKNVPGTLLFFALYALFGSTETQWVPRYPFFSFSHFFFFVETVFPATKHNFRVSSIVEPKCAKFYFFKKMLSFLWWFCLCTLVKKILLLMLLAVSHFSLLRFEILNLICIFLSTFFKWAFVVWLVIWVLLLLLFVCSLCISVFIWMFCYCRWNGSWFYLFQGIVIVWIIYWKLNIPFVCCCEFF